MIKLDLLLIVGYVCSFLGIDRGRKGESGHRADIEWLWEGETKLSYHWRK